MEMRKFIVTVYEDGSTSVVEYIPPEDHSLADYHAGRKDTQAHIERLLRHEIRRAELNSRSQEFGPGWKEEWATRAGCYKYILERIRQTIL